MASATEERAFTTQQIEEIRKQLDLVVHDDALRTSRRSVAFLRYIVEKTLVGESDELKERTIGVDVFGKALTYDTNLDHAVRTAASELRKRLAVYYSSERHRNELKIQLVPGSYIPQFVMSAPETSAPIAAESTPPPPTDVAPLISAIPEPGVAIFEKKQSLFSYWQTYAALLALVAFGIFAAVRWIKPHPTPQQTFWQPLLKGSGPVLLAVGDVPHGPPSVYPVEAGLFPSPNPAAPGPPTVPFADVVTIARISGVLSSFGKEVAIRRENSSTFADLRERPVVLIGAFNNKWSLRLTRDLRFSLALDSGKRILYIRDREHPDSRDWQWSIDPHPMETDRSGSAPLHDYALITRILDSETGHDIVVLGGLYTYGTQAAGELVSDPQMMSLVKGIPLDSSHRLLQIVIETRVTDATAGPPRIVAFHVD